MKGQCSIKIVPGQLIVKIDGEYMPTPPCNEVEVIHRQKYRECWITVDRQLAVEPVPITFWIDVKIDGHLWLHTERCVISVGFGLVKLETKNILTLLCDSDRTKITSPVDSSRV